MTSESPAGPTVSNALDKSNNTSGDNDSANKFSKKTLGLVALTVVGIIFACALVVMVGKRLSETDTLRHYSEL